MDTVNTLGARCWYAVHTRCQHEATVLQQLEFDGCEAYVPRVKEVRQWADRRKTIERPLFSCFVFVRAVYEPAFHHAVIRKAGVLGFVGVLGQGIPIPDSEMETVRWVVASKIECSEHPYVALGQRVRIRGGALEGLEAIVVQSTRKKVIVSVPTLQRSLEIQLEDTGYGIEILPAARAGALI